MPAHEILFPLNRRGFLHAAAGTAALAFAGSRAAAAIGSLPQPVKIGLIADLHHDLMHDGERRLKAFLTAMAEAKPDAIVQMGDFAYPKEANQPLFDAFNSACKVPLHVIGNHDTDAKHTVAQCLERWGMPAPYYTREVGGATLVVLDGNERGSPKYKAGYPSFLGAKQLEWLEATLAAGDGPVLVISHQPLAGPLEVDDAADARKLLAARRDRVLLCLCGHTHLDYLLRVDGLPFLHVNSASYYWIGGKYAHESYSKEVHAARPWIASTCPYRDPLFTTLTIDPQSLSISIAGRSGAWVGPSPAEAKADLLPSLTDGEEIAPRIRERRVVRKPA